MRLYILIDPKFAPVFLSTVADLEIRDENGCTLLILALTEPDNFEVVRALLAGGANPNALDDEGQTALEYAPVHGVAEATIDLLLKAGVSE